MRNSAASTRIIRNFLLLTFSTLVFLQSAQAAPTCRVASKAAASAPKSIDYFLDLVTAETKGLNTAPGFIDPKTEALLTKLWSGTKDVPQTITDTLLENTSVLDFPLLAADKGTVKMGEPGEFTSFRFNETWRDMNMSTNMGMPISAITARALEGGSMLVPQNARSVFIFLHGGGTKTTGHHVAASLANYMIKSGIVVISVDSPYHAYGQREQKLTPKEYYEYLRDFRNNFIPKDVPVFVGGHSMGGLHADNMMRLSDRQELGLREAFAGYINLSGPMDNAPGKSMAEKERIEDELNKNEELMALVPEAERDLSVSLLLAGKSSALGGLSAGTFMGMVDWKFPSHGGANYPPTLVVMGERDALYIGREEIFDTHLAQLSNTTTHLLGQRVNHNNEDIWVSHMIFDHYTPGTTDMETFSLIRDFIDTQIGSKSTKVDSLVAESSPASTHLGVLNRVVQAYYINLAFRHFASKYQMLVKKGTAKIGEMGQSSRALGKELKALSGELKTLNKDKVANQAEIENKKLREKALQAEIGALRAFQTSTFIPEEGPLQDFATSNVERRREIEDLLKTNRSQKSKLAKELTNLRAIKESLKKKIAKVVQAEFDQPSINLPELATAREAVAQALEVLLELQVQMNTVNNQMVTTKTARGEFDISPSPEHIAIYQRLDGAYASYLEADSALKAAIESAASQGHLGGPEFAAMITEVWGSIEAHRDGQATPDSLRQRTETLRADVRSLELENSELQTESDRLEIDYIQQVTPELYEVRMTTLEQELNRPFNELHQNVGSIERIWREWITLWKERPPEQGTSLY